MATTTAAAVTTASISTTTTASMPVTTATTATTATIATTATTPATTTSPGGGWETFANDLRREMTTLRQQQLLDRSKIATLTGENQAMQMALGIIPPVYGAAAGDATVQISQHPVPATTSVPIYSTTSSMATTQPSLTTQTPVSQYGTQVYYSLSGPPRVALGPGGSGDPTSPLYNPNVPPPARVPQWMGRFKAPDLNMTFSGEGDADTVSTAAKAFYYRIEDHIDIHNWDAAYAARMAYSNFKGKALAWITTERDSGETYISNWELLRKAFLDRWYSPLSMAEKTNRLKSLSQKREEKAADYFDRVKNVTELLYGRDPTQPGEVNPALREANKLMKEQIIITHFVGGLRQSVREVVANGDNKTLKEVREAAIRAENAAASSHTGNAKEILETSLLEDSKEVNANTKRPFNPKAGGGGGKKFDGNCAYCGKFAHRCRDCFIMKKDKEKGIFTPKDRDFFERMKRMRESRTKAANEVGKDEEEEEKNEERAADAVAAYYNFHNPLNF